jgi:hypothetical protein
MNKKLKTLIFASLIIMACNLQYASGSQSAPDTPFPTNKPSETAVPEIAQTESVPLASATPEFAPICDPNAASATLLAQCQVPIAKDSSAFCTKKTPYNLIFANKGSTFESLTEGFKCSDAGVKDGKQMITCTGQMASKFEVKVCDPACAVSTVQAAITQCPKDYSFDGYQGCCTQELQPAPQNCMVLKLQTTSCVVNCGEFSTKTACTKNSNACRWDEQYSVCVSRK